MTRQPTLPRRLRVLPTKTELERHLSAFPVRSGPLWESYVHVAKLGHDNFGGWLRDNHLDEFNRHYFDLVARPDDWPAVRDCLPLPSP